MPQLTARPASRAGRKWRQNIPDHLYNRFHLRATLCTTFSAHARASVSRLQRKGWAMLVGGRRARRPQSQRPEGERPEGGKAGGKRPGGERPEPRDAARWARDNGVTLGAVTLIVIQLLWMGTLLARSYFRQDDYFNFDRALATGFTWKYLMLVSAGHMAPLGFAISWLLARLALYSWPLTCIVILALVAAACFALLRVLRTLFGDRPAILIPLAVYLFCPLALAAVDWWSVAVQTLPLELSIFLAVDAHVRYVRSGRMRTAVAAAGWLLLGLATVQKGAVTPLLLFALTSGFLVKGRWMAGVAIATRRYWRAWLLYGVLLAGYCALFFSRLGSSTTPPSSPGPAGRVISFVSTLIGTTLVPGALGGPWRWTVIGDGYAQASPPAALQQLSWGLALLIVVASCVYRVRAWRAWAIIVGWIAVADVFPVVIGRLGVSQPALLGLQARYVTDAVSVLALCLGLAFLPLAGEEGGYRFRLPARAAPGSGEVPGSGEAPGAGAAPDDEGHEEAPGDEEPSRDEEVHGSEEAPGYEQAPGTGGVSGDEAAPRSAAPVLRPVTPAARNAILVLLAVFLGGSFWSLQALEGITSTQAARSYIATARIAVAKAPPGALIVDGPTPAFIMDPYLFYPSGYTSRVIGAIARGYPAKHLTWTTSPHGGITRTLMVFDAQGRLRPAALAGVASGPPRGHRCWKLAAAGTAIPLSRPLYRWSWTVRLDYSGPAAVLMVGFGGNQAQAALPAGTHAFYVHLAAGSGKAVTVTPLSAAPSQCLTGVTVGTWQPVPSGRPIPTAPAAG
jgi:hypothetical protein